MLDRFNGFCGGTYEANTISRPQGEIDLKLKFITGMGRIHCTDSLVNLKGYMSSPCLGRFHDGYSASLPNID